MFAPVEQGVEETIADIDKWVDIVVVGIIIIIVFVVVIVIGSIVVFVWTRIISCISGVSGIAGWTRAWRIRFTHSRLGPTQNRWKREKSSS